MWSIFCRNQGPPLSVSRSCAPLHGFSCTVHRSMIPVIGLGRELKSSAAALGCCTLCCQRLFANPAGRCDMHERHEVSPADGRAPRRDRPNSSRSMLSVSTSPDTSDGLRRAPSPSSRPVGVGEDIGGSSSSASDRSCASGVGSCESISTASAAVIPFSISISSPIPHTSSQTPWSCVSTAPASDGAANAHIGARVLPPGSSRFVQVRSKFLPDIPGSPR